MQPHTRLHGALVTDEIPGEHEALTPTDFRRYHELEMHEGTIIELHGDRRHTLDEFSHWVLTGLW